MPRNVSTSGHLPAAGFNALGLPVGLFRSLQAAMHRRHWRRTRPFDHLSDHLRRDVGLPPLDPGTRWW